MSDASKGTFPPGPWTVGTPTGHRQVPIWDANNICLCVVEVETAPLIAAAPAMHSLLKELEWIDVDRHDSVCPSCGAWRSFLHHDSCRLAAILKSVKPQ